MAGHVDHQHQRHFAGRRLNHGQRHLAAGHCFHILPRQAELLELSKSRLAKLPLDAFDKRLHHRIVDQLPPLRALEMIDQLPQVRHTDIAFGGGRQ